MNAVSYSRQTIKSRNPVARFAHTSRLKIGAELACKYLPPGGTLLDYGCGPGVFLEQLRQRPDFSGSVLGFDPYVDATRTSFHMLQDLHAIEDQSLDVITAFEVLEHLTDDELLEFLDFCRRALKRSAKIIVSVPIMIGPVLFVKCANSILFKRTPTQYSLNELFASAFLRETVSRADPKHSHKGFDFRKLRDRLLDDFTLSEESYQPFGWMPYGLNSQYFAVIENLTDESRHQRA